MADLLPLAQTNFRHKITKFGIKREDRRRHIYIIGKTGSGKTTLLENLIIHDINTNEGLAYLDPHGDSVLRILDYVPRQRLKDVIYFDPNDLQQPVAFNVLERVPFELRHIIASSLLSVFKKIWVDAWSARMEYILMNTLLSLLEFPDFTLLDINRMLGDDNFRKQVVSQLRDPVVKSFWDNEFARYHLNFRIEAIAPIQNKVGQFISNPLVRNIIGQAESTINLRGIMDERKILLVNLSKGALGEESAALLGGLIITKIQLAAMSRVDMPEDERKDFYLYVDEFQNFATDSFVNILAEARKYRLNLTLAHQYLDQVPESIIKAVSGNVGTFITFRLGGVDSEYFGREFGQAKTEVFTNLDKYNVYIRLLVDGVPTRMFQAETFPLPPKPSVSYADEITTISRTTYGRKREAVEKYIFQRYREARPGKDSVMVYCANCHQPFWQDSKEPATLCHDCESRSSASSVSLSSLASKNLSEPFKQRNKDQKAPEDQLEVLLKKLGYESKSV